VSFIKSEEQKGGKSETFDFEAEPLPDLQFLFQNFAIPLTPDGVFGFRVYLLHNPGELGQMSKGQDLYLSVLVVRVEQN